MKRLLVLFVVALMGTTLAQGITIGVNLELSGRPDAIELLRNECATELLLGSDDEESELLMPPESVSETLSATGVVLGKKSAICPMVSLADVPQLVTALSSYGYRPIRLRPFVFRSTRSSCN